MRNLHFIAAISVLGIMAEDNSALVSHSVEGKLAIVTPELTEPQSPRMAAIMIKVDGLDHV